MTLVSENSLASFSVFNGSDVKDILLELFNRNIGT